MSPVKPEPSPPSPSNPEPYTIAPTLPHKNTLILLHGTSTTGPTFASTILSIPIPSPNPSPNLSSTLSPSPSTLPTLFPDTKLIFPTGSPRRVTVLDEMANAWFDMHSFADRTVGEEDQVEGLRESVLYLGELVRREVGVVRAEGRGGRVVLCGFSQGCAVGVVGVLSGEFAVALRDEEEEGGECVRIVGFVGLSGWLPFRRDLDMILAQIPLDPAKDKVEKQIRVMSYIREKLGLDTTQTRSPTTESENTKRSVDIPIFLCHGKEDMKMKVEWGWEMARTLISARMRVWFTEYKDLEHWCSEKEMEDVVRFLKASFERGRRVGLGNGE